MAMQLQYSDSPVLPPTAESKAESQLFSNMAPPAQLRLKVRQARGLPKRVMFGKNKPQCFVIFSGTRRSTAVAYNSGSDPIWDTPASDMCFNVFLNPAHAVMHNKKWDVVDATKGVWVKVVHQGMTSVKLIGATLIPFDHIRDGTTKKVLPRPPHPRRSALVTRAASCCCLRAAASALLPRLPRAQRPLRSRRGCHAAATLS